jgi:hypothetical protein
MFTSFHSSKTDAATGDMITLELAVSNSIAHPEATVQTLVRVPPGLSIQREGLDGCALAQCSFDMFLAPGENTSFSVPVTASQAGSFDVTAHTEWFYDDPEQTRGKTETLTLSISDPKAGATSVTIHADKTKTEVGSPITLTLAAANSIAKPEMTLNLALEVPSGWSASGAGFTEACAGRCTATYAMQPGAQRNINLTLTPNQTGRATVEANMEWFFGEDRNTLQTLSKSLRLDAREGGAGASGGMPPRPGPPGPRLPPPGPPLRRNGRPRAAAVAAPTPAPTAQATWPSCPCPSWASRGWPGCAAAGAAHHSLSPPDRGHALPHAKNAGAF